MHHDLAVNLQSPALPARSGDLGSLARGAAAGESRAWEELVARFTPVLRAAARGFRLGAADVDDVVQSTWLAAFTHIHRLREPEAIGAWLLVTARREALRTLQRAVREVLVEEPREVQESDGSCQESSVAEAELREALGAAIGRLPDRQRQLVRELFGDSEPSYAELCRSLDMPIGAIGPTRERALERLRRDAELAAYLG